MFVWPVIEFRPQVTLDGFWGLGIKIPYQFIIDLFYFIFKWSIIADQPGVEFSNFNYLPKTYPDDWNLIKGRLSIRNIFMIETACSLPYLGNITSYFWGGYLRMTLMHHWQLLAKRASGKLITEQVWLLWQWNW
jgi:hypothetical protein